MINHILSFPALYQTSLPGGMTDDDVAVSELETAPVG